MIVYAGIYNSCTITLIGVTAYVKCRLFFFLLWTVFTEEQEANTFLGRHLLYNRFDFEIFTPGNLERECIEEVCNYEEAREVFENVPDTVE